MECPVCGAEMIRGRFGDHPERWLSGAYGPFGIPLLFEPAEAEGKDRVPIPCFAGGPEGQDGWCCPACRTAVLLEAPPAETGEEWICPVCKETVPGKLDRCWKCQHPRPA